MINAEYSIEYNHDAMYLFVFSFVFVPNGIFQCLCASVVVLVLSSRMRHRDGKLTSIILTSIQLVMYKYHLVVCDPVISYRKGDERASVCAEQ